MENEKFQDVVLEHLARITQEVTELKSGQQRLESDVATLKTDVAGLKSDVAVIKPQVAELVEFRTEAMEEFAKVHHVLDELAENTDFIKMKQMDNEAEIYKLKKKIS